MKQVCGWGNRSVLFNISYTIMTEEYLFFSTRYQKKIFFFFFSPPLLLTPYYLPLFHIRNWPSSSWFNNHSLPPPS